MPKDAMHNAVGMVRSNNLYPWLKIKQQYCTCARAKFCQCIQDCSSEVKMLPFSRASYSSYFLQCLQSQCSRLSPKENLKTLSHEGGHGH